MAKELIPSDPSQRTFAFKREATGMNCRKAQRFSPALIFSIIQLSI